MTDSHPSQAETYTDTSAPSCRARGVRVVEERPEPGFVAQARVADHPEVQVVDADFNE